MTSPATEFTVVFDAEAMGRLIDQLAYDIAGGNPDIGNVVILGILRRGRPLAERLARRLGKLTGTTPPVGSLATTLYRDDVRRGLAAAGSLPYKGETHFDFDVDGRTVLLVDDVLAAGRTIRAALDEVMDYGRPQRIQLACLIDRGGRELPIQPDYLSWTVSARDHEWVAVRLTELDGEDCVLIEHRPASEASGGGWRAWLNPPQRSRGRARTSSASSRSPAPRSSWCWTPRRSSSRSRAGKAASRRCPCSPGGWS
jgi:pyrimidine operon attenuation protein/uracil phosphoribosyltransferase